MAARSTTAREIPAAGMAAAVDGETASACLEEDDSGRPGTPPEIARFRKSHYSNPGQRVRHHGTVNDAFGDPTKAYGISFSGDAVHVGDLMAGERLSVYQEKKRQELEAAVYKQQTAEPLGKSALTGAHLPAVVKAKDFKFGVTSSASESAKNLVYPATAEDESNNAVYEKSHGSCPPGQQRKRYNLKETLGIDPMTHTFGAIDKSQFEEGVAACLTPPDNEARPNRIVRKQQEDFKALNSNALGKAKSLGHKVTQGPKGFGMPAMSSGEGVWDAAQCIQGDYSIEDQMPDADLGTAATPGWRNVATDSRSFGAPTVRKDKNPNAFRSIADNQNYGDDTDCGSLVAPSAHIGLGVNDQDFCDSREKDEIRDIFVGIGYNELSDDGLFESIWSLASAASEFTGDGEVSLQDFRNALNAYHDARRKK